MAIRNDVTGQERDYLLDMLGGDIGCALEIGCGDGRLTAKYAALAAIVGIDLPESLPDAGRGAFPERAEVAAASAVALPFQPERFDAAIFSLSL